MNSKEIILIINEVLRHYTDKMNTIMRIFCKQKQENKHRKLLNMLIAEGRRKNRVSNGQ
ncbi:hypothetical protein ES704_03935 [subsurface metagenome]|jgi:Trp operon repressor